QSHPKIPPTLPNRKRLTCVKLSDHFIQSYVVSNPSLIRQQHHEFGGFGKVASPIALRPRGDAKGVGASLSAGLTKQRLP
ncbi:MAG: hypothetical protein KME30_31980, partial [Iphinoe sp. HA4291-MV1]|nr:hypothetical protein [Iphinoe sp. HA4291-MV1]